jgi:hypothetical protein
LLKISLYFFLGKLELVISLYIFICLKVKKVIFKDGISSSLKLGTTCTDFAENFHTKIFFEKKNSIFFVDFYLYKNKESNFYRGVSCSLKLGTTCTDFAENFDTKK